MYESLEHLLTVMIKKIRSVKSEWLKFNELKSRGLEYEGEFDFDTSIIFASCAISDDFWDYRNEGRRAWRLTSKQRNHIRAEIEDIVCEQGY